MRLNKFGDAVAVKRRVYLDLDVAIHDKAKKKAAGLRVPTKRYIEALIEKDCGRVNGRKK